MRWTCSPYSVAAADRLASALGLSTTTATILVRRGYDSVEAARGFLAADDRHDPFLFTDMRLACNSILGHVAAGSAIAVHGDYDVDGICSTAIIVRALRRLGADPSWHLPSRFDDGYGISPRTVDQLAADGVRLLITADCGITAAAEVERAIGLGVEVIVTDHHRAGDLQPAAPILHPAAGYPFADLCAAGVAHKLAEALQTCAGSDPALADDDLDLVALATIADVVALRGENRRLVRSGLRALGRTRKPGLRALMRVARVDPGEVSAQLVGFRLCPRINAAGRLQRADAGLELVLTEDEDRASEVADELESLNRERRDIETRITFAAEAARAEQAAAPLYVLAGEGWHPGVIGIVASRIVERHHRPCVLVALDRGVGRGSGRSIAAYDLHAGLRACAAHLLRFGGHRAAAGLEIEASAVEDFRHALTAHAAAALAPADLQPLEPIDAIVPGGALGVSLAEELTSLAPFGHGNREPTLLLRAARIADVTTMGQDAQHLRFTVTGGGARARAVAFRTAPKLLRDAAEAPHDLAGRLELNAWNGTLEPRLVLRAVCQTEGGECRVLGEEGPFWAEFHKHLQGEAPASMAPASMAPAAEPRRTLCDRRGEGFAGVAADLISSGESVVVICADVRRRRDGLERLVAGSARCGGTTEQDVIGSEGARLAVMSWDTLAAAPTVASRFDHLLALDPPPSLSGEALLAAAPARRGAGFAHLGWGAAEAEFALAVVEEQLELRPPLTDLYRALRALSPSQQPLSGELLRGASYPRSPLLCARLVRVLTELGLLSYRPSDRAYQLLDSPPTSLERSPTFVACGELLHEAKRYLREAALPRPGAGVQPVPATVAG